MKIRQARFSDLDRILEIELENFSLEEAIPRSVFEAHLREIQTSFLVARDENQIVSYFLGAVVSGSDTQTSLILEIKRVAIHPDHCGQGLGTLLIAALKQETVELDYQGIFLQSPDELLSYFEMNGFVEEVTESHYGSGSERHLIWANLFYQEEI